MYLDSDKIFDMVFKINSIIENLKRKIIWKFVNVEIDKLLWPLSYLFLF